MNSMAVYSGKLPSFFSINVFIQSFIQQSEAVAFAPPEEVCKIEQSEAYRSSVVRSGVKVIPFGRLDKVERSSTEPWSSFRGLKTRNVCVRYREIPALSSFLQSKASSFPFSAAPDLVCRISMSRALQSLILIQNRFSIWSRNDFNLEVGFEHASFSTQKSRRTTSCRNLLRVLD